MSLELARSGPELKAVFGFHSGLDTAAPKGHAKNIKARVMVCIGADDRTIPAEQCAAFETEKREAGVDWQMHHCNKTVHSFINKNTAAKNKPEALSYSPEADARSRASLRHLFAEVLD